MLCISSSSSVSAGHAEAVVSVGRLQKAFIFEMTGRQTDGLVGNTADGRVKSNPMILMKLSVRVEAL